MDRRQSDMMTYFPVSPEKDRKASELSSTCFVNAVNPVPLKYLKDLYKKHVCCDSGGLQAFRALKAGKIVFIGSMIKSKLNDPDLFMLGIPSQCKEYARMNSSIAMCIDMPTNTVDTDLEYYRKLAQSRKSRKEMIKLARYICPDTKLGIVLQPRNPLEIKHYYCFIYDHSVRIYAYPIRNFRNKSKDAFGNAYVLSYLNNVGVEHVHFLGSNAPCIIFLLAHAVSLDLFKRVSFDSRTWDQKSLTGHRFLHPETLSTTPPAKQSGIHPMADLSDELAKFPGLIEATIGKFDPPDYIIAKDWLGILNIRIIEEFKNLVLSLAVDGQLEKYVKHFDKYGKQNNKKIIDAMRLLDESKDHGHKYIEKKYKTKVKELYC